MKVNRVQQGDNVLIDLTQDTVTPADLKKGKTAHDKSGEIIVGTHDDEYNWQPHDGMPDLTSVDWTNEDNIVYWTYDARDCDAWISFKITSKAQVALDCALGTITDGEFVPETTLTCKTNAEVRFEFPTTAYDYPVLKMKSSSPIYTVQSIASTRASASISGMAQRILDVRIKGTSITGLTSNRPFPLCVEHVRLEGITKWTSWSSMFSQAANLRQVDFIDCDTPNVTNMYQTFYYNRALRKITGYENFNVEKVTRMDNMFGGSTQLEKLDLSKWNTASVTTLASMFGNCKGLRELYVNNFDTSKVTTLANTFQDCSSLQELDLHSWDTSACTVFSNTFANMTSLKSINVTGWNVTNGTTFANIFNNAYCLMTLDVSTWTMPDFSDKTKVTQFIYNAIALHTFYIPHNWMCAISLTYSSLSLDSLLYLIDNIGNANGTQNLYLSGSLGKLTTAQIQTLTDKGWTVS